MATLPPGTLTGHGPVLQAPVGPVHWAGTETATAWCGYIDGALSRASGRPTRSWPRSAPDGGEGRGHRRGDRRAYTDWRERCNENTRLRKMLRGWDRVVCRSATDTGDTFTIEVRDTVLGPFGAARPHQADLVVTATSDDFADLFWGELNPSEKCTSGEIELAGSQEDVMRLDAMSMVAFLEQ